MTKASAPQTNLGRSDRGLAACYHIGQLSRSESASGEPVAFDQLESVVTQTSRKLSPHQNAIRLFFILKEGATAAPREDETAEGAVSVFHGEARLHAMDFWVRNPDYLAHELLQQFRETRNRALLDRAAAILDSDEPDLRRYPMIRYLYGAYERIDNAVGVLVSAKLVKVRISETDGLPTKRFLLLDRADPFADSAVAKYPVLGWFRDRARAVAQVAGGRRGTALKERQYEHIEYARTRLGTTIPAITDNVRADLKHILEKL